ncbi:MAG TPA: DinB family protein [Roseiflexaceae bacterium]|nr:DinB family protein [Roseiflexaceae bacterium]
MSQGIAVTTFLADLRTRMQQHCEQVREVFGRLDPADLQWKPNASEWCIGQCFDHLNLTYAYYRPRILEAQAAHIDQASSEYSASRWGRFYMFFALNPRFSFPTAPQITPTNPVHAGILERYLANQDELNGLLNDTAITNRLHVRVPIERGVSFVLGDCLKILVYHDGVHFLQAQRVLAQRQAAVG